MRHGYQDCPVCGVNGIPDSCSQCGECEVAERYEKKLDAIRDEIEKSLPALEALALSNLKHECGDLEPSMWPHNAVNALRKVLNLPPLSIRQAG